MWIDDQILKRASEDLVIESFIPQKTMVVLGSANLATMEVRDDLPSGIEVLKRAGGGGTVVLYPGAVVVSVGCWVRQHFQNRIYFAAINQAIIDVLQSKLSSPLSQKGISDLCVHERKFAGTSMFRSKNYLLYQASLICQLDVDLIETCLRHPSREPDYRRGRTHRDFLIGLSEVNPSLDSLAVCQSMQQSLRHSVEYHLSHELQTADPDHIEHIIRRAQLS